MDISKRKAESEGETNIKKAKMEVCPHAERCYRRNPHHFKEYDHPHLNEFMKQGDHFTLPESFPQDKNVVLEQLEVLKSLSTQIKPSTSNITKNTDLTSNKKIVKTTSHILNSSVDGHIKGTVKNMSEKLKNSNPYNLFFTKIPKAKETLEDCNSITFTDLLCPSLGELKCSLQINFMIDIMWLMEQYQAQGVSKKPMTILYGYEFPNMKEYMDKFLPNVTYHLVQMKDPFGTHHSKFGLYLYTDGSLRVVVSTANLYYEDWNHYNQGLWISPTCPPLPENSKESDGIGPTGFKSMLLNYLQSYKVSILQDWINCVKKADFSAVRVFLVASIPGKHYPKSTGSHIHRVADLLSRHCSLPPKTTPQSEGPLSWGINAQASSIGSLGKSPSDWLRGTLLRSLSVHKQGQLTSNSNATLNVIFPTVDNVMTSYFGAEGGGCLPYSKATHEKQKWLKDYLHQWKADRTHRSRVMPHNKTYCRISPCLTKMAWLLLTSANISKSAWGGNIQKDSSVYVRSYEMGVLFLPSFFEEEYFNIANGDGEEKKLFPFMYDLPLTSYGSSDYPWCN